MSELDELLCEAMERHQAGDLRAAGERYREVLALKPADPHALHGLGVVSFQLGEPEVAAALIGRAVEAGEVPAHYHHDHGEALAADGQVEPAIAAFQRALEVDPGRGTTHARLGNLLCQQRRWEPAIEHFEHAIHADIESADNDCALARAWLGARNDAVQAVKCLRRAVAVGGGSAESFRSLAEAFCQQGHLPEAEEALDQSVANDANFTRAFYLRGVVHAQQGNLTAAVHDLNRAIVLKPDYAEAHRGLAAIEHRLEHWDTALTHYQRAAELGMNDVELKVETATVAEKAGQIDEAIRVRLEIRKQRPDWDHNEFNLAALTKQKPPPTPPVDMVVSTFNSYAETFDGHLVETLHYQGPELLRAVVEQCRPEGDLRILDLGCGTGLCGEKLQHRKSRLVGVDMADKMIEVARQRNLYDQLHVADLVTFLRSAESFDVVLAGDVFIYLGDLDEVHAAIRRLLSPQGVFAYTLEVADCDQYQLARGHRYSHSPDYVDALAQRHGFTVRVKRPAAIREEGRTEVPGMVVALQPAE